MATLDQPQSTAATVIPVKYASVMDLAQTINRLMLDGSLVATGSTDASQRFMLMADARTNSLLLRTDSPARIKRVQELVEKLDMQTSAPGNIHVVYLKNAEATKLAVTLRAVLSGDTSVVPSGTPGVAGTATGSTPAAPIVPLATGGMIQADAASNALIITAPDAV